MLSAKDYADLAAMYTEQVRSQWFTWRQTVLLFNVFPDFPVEKHPMKIRLTNISMKFLSDTTPEKQLEKNQCQEGASEA